MILVLAALGDEGAAAMVDEMAPLPATAVSCLDFAAAPSSLRHPGFEMSTITLTGQAVQVTDICAVVNALPAVMPGELAIYDVAEREYQAAELHAWLTYFLTALPCPVFNRPSALSLVGPALSPLGWFHLAREAGIPVAPLEIDSANPAAWPWTPSSLCTEVTWVKGAAVRTQSEHHTAALARHCNIVHLTAWYDEQLRFSGARSVPDLTSQRTRRALIKALTA